MDASTLRSNSLFAGLDAGALDGIASELVACDFAAGDTIDAGPQSHRIYLFTAGHARLLERGADGGDLEITRLGPGECFGGASVAPATRIVADGRLQGCWLERERLPAVAERWPRFAANLLAASVALLERVNASLAERVQGDSAALRRLSQQRGEQQARTNDRVRRELEIAQRVQRNLLPDRHREIAGVSIDAEYVPCEELGGDIVGAFQVDETRVALYGGDVSGHGIYAAVVMSYVKKLVESSVKRVLLKGQYVVKPPGAVLTTINQGFISEISQGDPEIYLTLFLGVLDLRDLTLAYASAGVHRSPLVLSDGRLEPLFDSSEYPIGHVPGHEYQTRGRPLKQGDLFLFVSDGVTEASRDGEPYGMERLERAVTAGARGPSGLVLSDLLASVEQFLGSGKPQDDMCFLLMKVRAALPPLA